VVSMLGIGGSNHDFSAAIVRDGDILVAVEDERVQRVKHGRTGWSEQPARAATEYCLRASGLALEELDGVLCCKDLERPAAWLDWEQVTFVDHHLAHASASFFTSPFDDAALLVIDGHGGVVARHDAGYELETVSIGRASGTEIVLGSHQTGTKKSTSNSWRYIVENSIGYFYELVTAALGFGGSGQGKTMGLAAYGSTRFRDELAEFVTIHDDGRFDFDPYAGINDWLTQTLATEANSMQVRADIACSTQEIFVDAIVAVATEAQRQTGARHLAFGGGCALNTLANSRILAETSFEDIWVYPAAGDNGLGVGAALYGAHAIAGRPRAERRPGWRSRVVFTGRTYDEAEVEKAIESAPVHAVRPDDLVAAVATALVSGDTVALFQGGGEIGPRALGHRSLLALPSTTRMRDHINLNIKERESFRPLAPVVPIEHVHEHFDDVDESPFMLFVARVRDESQARLAGVTHIDGTARVQTVRSEDNPFLHELLCRVGAATGVPVLINTSLNGRNEPIVETPADAISLFIDRPIDLLVLESHLVRKYTPWAEPANLPAT
jgi:carbamoyltransferase